MGNVKIKVFLGYFTLIVLASFMVWIIYSRILDNSGPQGDMVPANKKIMYINTILTNLYEAEGLGRNYAQTGKLKDHDAYQSLMDTVSLQIDRLAEMTNNPIQQIHTDSIKKLLEKKHQNLKELSAAKMANSSSARYQQALEKLSASKDSINNYLQVYKKVTTNYDSVYIKQRKKKFLERLANVFSSKGYLDSALHVSVNQNVQLDSLMDSASPADSIKDFFAAIIADIRDENLAMEKRLKQKELEAFKNDLVITMQLRRMLSNIENEELINSFRQIKVREAKIQKTTWFLIILGGLSLGTIIFFLVNILKDLTKSQHYRQSLEAANAFSESLLKSKEQFMLSLTHDLKSPLSSIIGFAGLMEENVASPRQRLYLQRIKKASDHILRLINDLLDLARLDTGKLKIDYIPFNLKSLVTDAVENFRPQAIEKNIGLKYELNIPPYSNYKSDPLRITQILMNLLSNAIKFTEKGYVTVRVSVTRPSEKNDEVCIEVIDTGIGISQEHIQRIFEEFGRVTSAQRQYEGTGLGLTITRKIVQLLHGSITLKSNIGKGSHFTVLLPLERETNIQERLPSQKDEDLKRLPGRLTGKKVWLIDDDQTFLEMTTRVLESAGMVVFPFSAPSKAIDEFKKGSVDFLITDIQMPGINGFELMRRIREKGGNDLIAIAMSGRNITKDEHDGFNGFILKPFQPINLISVISGRPKKTAMHRMSFGKKTMFKVPGQKEYNLDNIAAFASGEPESLKQILASFINSGKQNTALFRQYLHERNGEGISELAHKMLPLFRQLEAYDIVVLLDKLEHKNGGKPEDDNFYERGHSVIVKIEQLLATIQHEEGITV